MIMSWVHPDMVKRLRQYGSFLNQFYILEMGQIPQGGEQLSFPAPTLADTMFNFATTMEASWKPR